MKLNVWRFSDGLSGHDAQSNGLCLAIKEIVSIEQFDLDIDSIKNCLKNLLLKKFPMGEDLPNPDIIIGAGHGTHLTMLTARYIRKGKIIVLMKPSLPLNLFDICIIPKHDSPPKQKNVIETTGALNSIEFNKHKQKNKGLILIGGPSNHYQWSNKLIAQQINEIISTHKEIDWTIANSRRTPKNMLSMITASTKKKYEIINYNDSPKKNIKQLVFASETIWVTPDSVSMIFESLSSGALVGLFNLKEKKTTRITIQINNLVSNNNITTFGSWKKKNKLKNNNLELNEAHRCALVLQKKGLLNEKI